MARRYHAIVWIDHNEARIFQFDHANVDRVVIHPDQSSYHSHYRSNRDAQGRDVRDPHFLHGVAMAVAGSEKILIVGPAKGKAELARHIREHEPVLAPHVAGVETVDQPTDEALVALARLHFKDDHQDRPA